MERPNSLAVSIHSAITTSTALTASERVAPSAEQPGKSGASAMNARSSSLQLMKTGYLGSLTIDALFQPVFRPAHVHFDPHLAEHRCLGRQSLIGVRGRRRIRHLDMVRLMLRHELVA